MFTDTHCHLSKEDYEDIDKVVANAKENKIDRLIICGCDKNGIKEAVDIANKYENIYFCCLIKQTHHICGYISTEKNKIISQSAENISIFAVEKNKKSSAVTALFVCR